MRWFWIDRFVEFESGRRAKAVKNISLAESHLHDHFPGAPIMPNSLIVEGIAQTGGLLVGEHSHFVQRVVLAKLSRASFHFAAVPGDTLTYETTIHEINASGAIVAGTSHCEGRLQAEVDIVFAHLDENFAGKSLFDPATFAQWLKMVGIYRVGKAADGSALTIPPELEAV